MDAKEKAKQLVDKINLKMPPQLINNSININECLKRTLYNAKQCALIAVDEIILVLQVAGVFSFEKDIDFWQQVKIEIEKL